MDTGAQKSFESVIFEALTYLADDAEMAQPVISHHSHHGAVKWEFSSAHHIADKSSIWLHVEPDSFGEYDPKGDLHAEAEAIACNMFETAMQDAEATLYA